MIKIISQSEEQTRKIGQLLGEEFLETLLACSAAPLNKQAFIIALEGELGSGKTTFVQGLAKGLNIKERILSPTFVIFKKFDIGSRPQGRRTAALRPIEYFYHIDCYRLRRPKDLLDLGFQELIQDPQNLIVIEWADRVRKTLPKDRITIRFKWIDKNKRVLTVSSH